jgi:hypothetical protein
MKRLCDICGCEADDHWMESYNIGAKTVWLCWACYKNSQYQAKKSDLHRHQRLYKIQEAKKRHR